MDTNNQSVIIDGANPSMLWYNIADYIGNLSKYMVKTYKQRKRSNKQITWGELDKVNQDLHNQLDIIISGDRNVKTISENREMNKKQVIRLTENQFHQIVKETVKNVLKENRGRFANLVDEITEKFNQLYKSNKEVVDSHTAKVKSEGEFKDLEVRLAWDLARAARYWEWECLPKDEQGFINANDGQLTTLFKQAFRNSNIEY